MVRTNGKRLFDFKGQKNGWAALLTAAALAVGLVLPQGLAAGQAGEATVGKSASGKKFLYLDDGSQPAATAGKAALAPLPPLFLENGGKGPAQGLAQGLEGLATLDGAGRFVIEINALRPAVPGIRPTITALGSQHRTGFQIGYPLSAGEREFGVWLSTEAARQSLGFLGRWQSVPLAPLFGQNSYNVGLNVGYSGFTLGAALSREVNGFDIALQGIDLGFGYHGERWFANIQAGDYRGDRNPLFFGLYGERDRQVLQLGAGYSFWPNLSLSGRFRYFDYSNPFFPGLGGLSQEHVFTLDTKLNF